MAPPIIKAPEEPPFQLKDVKRLRLHPDDVIVLRVLQQVSREWIESTWVRLKDYFPDNRLVILGPEVDIGVIGPEPEEEAPANGQHPGEIGVN